MIKNINTREYWEYRFSSGDWERNKGRWQSESFAKRVVPLLNIPTDFEGTLLDFGCGLGDAIPVYRQAFPSAKLIGFDHSSSAIKQCRENYGELATLIQGDYDMVPTVDVIVSVAVFEHLSDHLAAARHLLKKCKNLYIVVPYKERPLCSEHVNAYDEATFASIGPCRWTVFHCRGWSKYGLRLLYDIYLKNIVRLLIGRPMQHQARLILFQLTGTNQGSKTEIGNRC